MPNAPSPSPSFLLCRSGPRLCALPLGPVRETMRALPLEAVPGMPPCLSGLAVIRGAPVPVLDLGRLLGGPAGAAESTGGTRYITLELAQRQVALAVDAVLGVRALDDVACAAVPPLLHGAEASLLAALGTLDAELLLVLQAARLVHEGLWQALDARESA